MLKRQAPASTAPAHQAKVGSGASPTQEKPHGCPRLGSETGAFIPASSGAPGARRKTRSQGWGPACNTGHPRAVIYSGCVNLMPRGGPSVGLQDPSACVLRNLVSGNFSGHAKRLVFNFRGGRPQEPPPLKPGQGGG